MAGSILSGIRGMATGLAVWLGWRDRPRTEGQERAPRPGWRQPGESAAAQSGTEGDRARDGIWRDLGSFLDRSRRRGAVEEER